MGMLLNIFEYSDYRLYLKAWIEKAKAEKTSNLSRLAEAAQVHPTFLSHALAGTKDLSLEQAALLSAHFGLTKLEQDYFFILIQLDRAGNHRLKQYWLDKKTEIESEKNKLSQRFEKHRQLTTEQRAIFYSSWIYAAIWSATAFNDGQSPAQISEYFHLSRDKVVEVLSFLTQVGLCKEESGKYFLGESHVHVPNESPFVVKHHTNWRMKAIQKMDSRDSEELFFTAPMSIAKNDFNIVREKINVALKEIVEVAKESPAEEVVCLNIDFFRIKK